MDLPTPPLLPPLPPLILDRPEMAVLGVAARPGVVWVQGVADSGKSVAVAARLTRAIASADSVRWWTVAAGEDGPLAVAGELARVCGLPDWALPWDQFPALAGACADGMMGLPLEAIVRCCLDRLTGPAAGEAPGGPSDSPRTLVIDDVHRLRDADAQALIAALIRQRPPTLSLWLISREAPPAAIAQALSDTSSARSSEPSIGRLAAVNMLPMSGRTGELAAEIASAWPASMRALLRQLSRWPSFEFEDAAWLPGAQTLELERILEDLQRRGLLLQDERGALRLPAFLSDWIQGAQGDPAMSSPLAEPEPELPLRPSIEGLRRAGHVEAALRRAIATGEPVALERQLVADATRFETEGRILPWLHGAAIAGAGRPILSSGLLRSRGQLLRHLAPGIAQAALEAAARAAAATQDVDAELAALAHLVDVAWWTGAASDRFQALARAMRSLVARHAAPLPGSLELLVRTRMALSIAFSEAEPGELHRHAQAALLALPREESPIRVVEAASVLLGLLLWGNRTPVLDALIESVEQRRAGVALPPALEAVWRLQVARRNSRAGRHDAALEGAGAAARLAAEGRHPMLKGWSEVVGVGLLLHAGRLDEAGEALQGLAHGLSDGRSPEALAGALPLLRAMLALRSGETEEASRQAALAEAALVRVNARGVSRIAAATLRGHAASALGRAADARAAYDAAADHAAGGEPDSARLHRALGEALILAAQDDAAAPAGVASALDLWRARNAEGLLRHHPAGAALVCSLGLRDDPAPAALREVIKRQGLRPPDLDDPRWPWPLAVRAFGVMELVVAGVPVVERGKTQQKPQALLALLLAAGPEGIERGRAAGRLWAADEVSAPAKALEVTVHRLRKWLGDDAAILVRQGHVILDGARVWSDVAALERLTDRVEQGAFDNATATALRRAVADAVALYRGPFCPGVSYPSIDMARERQRRRFLALSQRLAERCDARGLQDAADLLRAHAAAVATAR